MNKDIEITRLHKVIELLELRIKIRDARIRVLEDAIEKGHKPMTIEYVEEIIRD